MDVTCGTSLLSVEIRVEQVRGPAIEGLLREHLTDMMRHSPVESVHALDLDRLRADDITFWTVTDDAELLGCGALRELTADHGEVKSMRTAQAHLRRGVAAALLQHLVDEAIARGYRRLSLETGSGPAFAPARALYARSGFSECGPFGEYVEDPYSVFMTRRLSTA